MQNLGVYTQGLFKIINFNLLESKQQTELRFKIILLPCAFEVQQYFVIIFRCSCSTILFLYKRIIVAVLIYNTERTSSYI